MVVKRILSKTGAVWQLIKDNASETNHKLFPILNGAHLLAIARYLTSDQVRSQSVSQIAAPVCGAFAAAPVDRLLQHFPYVLVWQAAFDGNLHTG